MWGLERADGGNGAFLGAQQVGATCEAGEAHQRGHKRHVQDREEDRGRGDGSGRCGHGCDQHQAGDPRPVGPLRWVRPQAREEAQGEDTPWHHLPRTTHA